jgi:hypothetical protein
MKPRFTKWEWLVLALVLAVLLSALVGCTRGSVPGGAPSIPGPASIVTRIGTIALAIGSAGLVACGFLAWFYPNKFTVLKLFIACLTLIASGAVLHFVAAHLGWLVACGVVLVAGYLCYRHVARLEKALGMDLNRDGKIGRP